MTSTNDGKDLKSNTTTGPKGKTFYIELYKFLEARLSEGGDVSERNKHLCEAWRRVHSLCQHSAPSTHTHLLAWLHRHTARAVLQAEWRSPERKDDRSSLEEAINSFIAESEAARVSRNGVVTPWEGHLVARGEWFKRNMDQPWDHPVLTLLLNPNGTPPTDDEVLRWLKEERGLTFAMRLQTLCDERLYDIAISLAAAVMERVRASLPSVVDLDVDKDKAAAENAEPTFGDRLKEEAGFSTDVWDLLTDIEFVLLHKRDSKRCIALAKQTPLSSAYHLIERLQKRLETSPREKKLWKNAKEVAILIAQVVIARCMMVPLCVGTARTALYCCARVLAQLLPPARLPAAADVLAHQAPTARHLHTLASAAHNQLSLNTTSSMKPYVCELYVRAITAGMNELERLKLKTEKMARGSQSGSGPSTTKDDCTSSAARSYVTQANELHEAEARLMEKTLASWFVQLGAVLSQSDRILCECTLTAFSLHPTQKMYERLDAAPQPAPVVAEKEESKDETAKTEFGSWANDSRSQTNFVKTSETLNMKQTQNQANVLSTAIFNEGEALGLSPELCQDIAVLLSGPRVKTLSWDMDRTLLLDNCRKYMESTHGGTRVLTRELKYLNINLDMYQHLPEDRDDDENDPYYGIERGYEHLVPPEDIWEDAYNEVEKIESASSSIEEDYLAPRRKKKNKRVPRSTDEDSNPLSVMAEEKRVQKKKERPHSKERSKERVKKKLEMELVDPLHIDDLNETEKKEKPKKERKKKESIPKPKPKKSLASLIGLKVVKRKKRPVIKATTTVIPPAITDSDYDSQGKKSLNSLNSESCDPNKQFGNMSSANDGKSSERSSSHSMGHMKYNDLRVASSMVGLKSRPSHSLDRPSNNLTKTSDRLLPPNAVEGQSPSKNPRNNSPNFRTSSDSVRTSLSELLEFRRHKSMMDSKQQQKLQRPPRKPAIIRPQTPVQTNISPKAVTIPEIPKSYISKLTEKAKEKVNNSLSQKHRNDFMMQRQKEIDYLLAQKKKSISMNSLHTAIPSPVIQYAKKGACSIGTTSQPQSSQQQFKSNSIKMTDLVDVPYDRLMAEIAERQDSRGKYDIVKPPHSQPQLSQPVPIHRTLNNVSAGQRDYQNFLKEYEKTKYYTDRALDMTKTQSKNMKPTGRIIPVVPNVKAEPKALQCAKQSPQKKMDNSLHTFSRLSYMHKNKQIEMKNKQTLDKPLFSSTTYQEVSSELDEIIKKHQREQMKVIQAKKEREKFLQKSSQITAQNHNQSTSGTNPPGLPLQTTGIKSKNHPFLSNSLNQSSSSSNVSESHNETQYKHKVHISSDSSPKSSLSQKDQNDLLHLLRQQNNLNIRHHRKTDFNSKPSTSNFTSVNIDNTSPVSQSNLTSCQKQQQLSTQNSYLKNCRSSFENKIINIISNSLIKPANSTFSVNLNSEVTVTATPKFTTSATKNTKITCGQDKVDKVVANKTNAEKIPHKHIPETETPEWQAVMSDLLKHRTPTRGPNALDVALNKSSFELAFEKSLQEPRIFASPSNEVKCESAIKNESKVVIPKPANTIPNVNSSSKGVKVQGEVIKQQKSFSETKKYSNLKTLNTPIIKQNPSDIAKKQLQDNQRKQFTYAGTKHDDPFISGIPNSDYDLLEELMDDDLRKEIGELSSDDESYNTAAQSFLKPCKSTEKRVSVQFNKPLNDLTVKKPLTNVRCLNANITNDINQTASPECTNKHRTTIKICQKAVNNDNTPSNPCLTTSIAPSVSTLIQTTPNIYKQTYSNAETLPENQVIHSNVYISPVTQQAPLQNVVLIGSQLVYETYSTVHAPVHCVTNITPNAYVSAPSLSLYQTTQFAAPVVSPLIIGSSMTVPLINNTIPVQTNNTVPVQTNLIDNVLQPTYSATTVEAQTKLAHPQMYIESSDSNTKISTPGSVIECPLQKSQSTDTYKISERKVLSEVQEFAVPEKIDKIIRIQKIEADLTMKNDADGEQERLKNKRLAIINRELYHRCRDEPIPLAYAPLCVKPQIISNQQNVQQTIPFTYEPQRPDEEVQKSPACEDKLLTSIPNDVHNISKHIDDVKSPSTPDSTESKENKNTPTVLCRRILLRSCNKITSKSNTDLDLSESSSNKTSDSSTVVKKSKTKLKSVVPENVAKNASSRECNTDDKEELNTKKRASKRLRNKTLTMITTKELEKPNTKNVVKASSKNQRQKSVKVAGKIENPDLPRVGDDISMYDIEAELLGSKITKPVTKNREIYKKDLNDSKNHKVDTDISVTRKATDITLNVSNTQKTEIVPGMKPAYTADEVAVYAVVDHIDKLRFKSNDTKCKVDTEVILSSDKCINDVTSELTQRKASKDDKPRRKTKSVTTIKQPIVDKVKAKVSLPISIIGQSTAENGPQLTEKTAVELGVPDLTPETKTIITALVADSIEQTVPITKSPRNIVCQPKENDEKAEKVGLPNKESIDLDMTVTCEEVNVTKMTYDHIRTARNKSITSNTPDDGVKDDENRNSNVIFDQIDVEPVPASWKIKNTGIESENVRTDQQKPCVSSPKTLTTSLDTDVVDGDVIIDKNINILKIKNDQIELNRPIYKTPQDVSVTTDPMVSNNAYDDIIDDSLKGKQLDDEQVDLNRKVSCKTLHEPSTTMVSTATKNTDDDIVILDDSFKHLSDEQIELNRKLLCKTLHEPSTTIDSRTLKDMDDDIVVIDDSLKGKQLDDEQVDLNRKASCKTIHGPSTTMVSTATKNTDDDIVILDDSFKHLSDEQIELNRKLLCKTLHEPSTTIDSRTLKDMDDDIVVIDDSLKGKQLDDEQVDLNRKASCKTIHGPSTTMDSTATKNTEDDIVIPNDSLKHLSDEQVELNRKVLCKTLHEPSTTIDSRALKDMDDDIVVIDDSLKNKQLSDEQVELNRKESCKSLHEPAITIDSRFTKKTDHDVVIDNIFQDKQIIDNQIKSNRQVLCETSHDASPITDSTTSKDAYNYVIKDQNLKDKQLNNEHVESNGEVSCKPDTKSYTTIDSTAFKKTNDDIFIVQDDIKENKTKDEQIELNSQLTCKSNREASNTTDSKANNDADDDVIMIEDNTNETPKVNLPIHNEDSGQKENSNKESFHLISNDISKIPQSFKDSLKIKHLPSDNPLYKSVLVTLPNGKKYKAAVYGEVNVTLDTLFACPSIKSALMNKMSTKKLFMNVNQVTTVDKRDRSKILSAQIKDPTSDPVDTIDLLSDDEDNLPRVLKTEIQTFETQYGKYKISPIDKEAFVKHQVKLSQKTLISLKKIEPENHIKIPNNEKIEESKPMLPIIPDKYVVGLFNDIENKLNSESQKLSLDATEVVEIDDSSNESSDQCNSIEEPADLIGKLKTELLKELGVGMIASASHHSESVNIEKTVTNKCVGTNEMSKQLFSSTDKSDASKTGGIKPKNVTNKCVGSNAMSKQLINLTDKCDRFYNLTKEEQLKIIDRKCHIKLVRCDSFVKTYEKEDQEIIEVIEHEPIAITEDFSILNDLDRDIVESDARSSSPVIELSDVLVSLDHVSVSSSESAVQQVLPLTCEAEWFTSKPAISWQRINNMRKMSIGVRTNIQGENSERDIATFRVVNEPKVMSQANCTSSLMFTVLKYLQETDFIKQHRPCCDAIIQSPVISLNQEYTSPMSHAAPKARKDIVESKQVDCGFSSVVKLDSSDTDITNVAINKDSQNTLDLEINPCNSIGTVESLVLTEATYSPPRLVALVLEYLQETDFIRKYRPYFDTTKQAPAISLKRKSTSLVTWADAKVLKLDNIQDEPKLIDSRFLSMVTLNSSATDKSNVKRTKIEESSGDNPVNTTISLSDVVNKVIEKSCCIKYSNVQIYNDVERYASLVSDTSESHNFIKHDPIDLHKIIDRNIYSEQITAIHTKDYSALCQTPATVVLDTFNVIPVNTSTIVAPKTEIRHLVPEIGTQKSEAYEKCVSSLLSESHTTKTMDVNLSLTSLQTVSKVPVSIHIPQMDVSSNKFELDVINMQAERTVQELETTDIEITEGSVPSQTPVGTYDNDRCIVIDKNMPIDKIVPEDDSMKIEILKDVISPQNRAIIDAYNICTIDVNAIDKNMQSKCTDPKVETINLSEVVTIDNSLCSNICDKNIPLENIVTDIHNKNIEILENRLSSQTSVKIHAIEENTIGNSLEVKNVDENMKIDITVPKDRTTETEILDSVPSRETVTIDSFEVVTAADNNLFINVCDNNRPFENIVPEEDVTIDIEILEDTVSLQMPAIMKAFNENKIHKNLDLKVTDFIILTENTVPETKTTDSQIPEVSIPSQAPATADESTIDNSIFLNVINKNTPTENIVTEVETMNIERLEDSVSPQMPAITDKFNVRVINSNLDVVAVNKNMQAEQKTPVSEVNATNIKNLEDIVPSVIPVTIDASEVVPNNNCFGVNGTDKNMSLQIVSEVETTDIETLEDLVPSQIPVTIDTFKINQIDVRVSKILTESNAPEVNQMMETENFVDIETKDTKMQRDRDLTHTLESIDITPMKAIDNNLNNNIGAQNMSAEQMVLEMYNIKKGVHEEIVLAQISENIGQTKPKYDQNMEKRYAVPEMYTKNIELHGDNVLSQKLEIKNTSKVNQINNDDDICLINQLMETKSYVPLVDTKLGIHIDSDLSTETMNVHHVGVIGISASTLCNSHILKTGPMMLDAIESTTPDDNLLSKSSENLDTSKSIFNTYILSEMDTKNTELPRDCASDQTSEIADTFDVNAIDGKICTINSTMQRENAICEVDTKNVETEEDSNSSNTSEVIDVSEVNIFATSEGICPASENMSNEHVLFETEGRGNIALSITDRTEINNANISSCSSRILEIANLITDEDNTKHKKNTSIITTCKPLECSIDKIIDSGTASLAISMKKIPQESSLLNIDADDMINDLDLEIDNSRQSSTTTNYSCSSSVSQQATSISLDSITKDNSCTSPAMEDNVCSDYDCIEERLAKIVGEPLVSTNDTDKHSRLKDCLVDKENLEFENKQITAALIKTVLDEEHVAVKNEDMNTEKSQDSSKFLEIVSEKCSTVSEHEYSMPLSAVLMPHIIDGTEEQYKSAYVPSQDWIFISEDEPAKELEEEIVEMGSDDIVDDVYLDTSLVKIDSDYEKSFLSEVEPAQELEEEIIKMGNDEIVDDICFDTYLSKIENDHDKTCNLTTQSRKRPLTIDDCSSVTMEIDLKPEHLERQLFEKDESRLLETYIKNESSTENYFQGFDETENNVHNNAEATLTTTKVSELREDTKVINNLEIAIATKIPSFAISNISSIQKYIKNVEDSHESSMLMEENEKSSNYSDDIEARLAEIVGEPLLDIDNEEKSQRYSSHTFQEIVSIDNKISKNKLTLNDKYTTLYNVQVEEISDSETNLEDIATQLGETVNESDSETFEIDLKENTTECSALNKKNSRIIHEYSTEVSTDHFEVIIPKLTYSRGTEHNRQSCKNLKRKIDMSDVKTHAKKYRKGKNIDYPKITAATISENAYAKEYKRLFEYCQSVKFSYAISFHKDQVDVDQTHSSWPIENSNPAITEDLMETNEPLFTDLEKVKAISDPLEQTFSQEIASEFDENSYKPSNIDETNFNMGFGEGSGRVIQELEDGEYTTFSAATLSDVKQLQPLLPSDDIQVVHSKQQNVMRNHNNDEKLKFKQFIEHLKLREKVKSFFAKTEADLNWWQKNEKKCVDSSDEYINWPFCLASPNYIRPSPVEITAHVVQVGQLPVSAAAQNPVTCDPRVTHVSNVSPSQCSPENSSGDDVQTNIKTEYTELTTADITLPLMQEYVQHHQSMPTESQDSTNLYGSDENEPMSTQIQSVVKIEFMEETSQENMEENESYESNDVDHISNGDVGNGVPQYQFDQIANNVTAEVEPSSQTVDNSSDKNKTIQFFAEEKQRSGTSDKSDQIAHAMNAAGIISTPRIGKANIADVLVSTMTQNTQPDIATTSQANTNNYTKSTSINAIALQHALAQILPPPLNQTTPSENNQQAHPPILHIVQGNNAQSVINKPNGTQLLHIVQSKSSTPASGTPVSQSNNFAGLSLVDGAIQQNGNQLLHIVNTGNQKNNSGQLLKRVNLLTNLANVQGSNEQKMVQFVCKSADGKSIQLPHQRSMVLRLQPIDPPNASPTPKQNEAQDHHTPSSDNTQSGNSKESSPQEMKSRSLYEENYAKFVQNENPKPVLETSTSLPKFNQVFGKQVYQEKQNELEDDNIQENSNCTSEDTNVPLEQMPDLVSSPMIVRKTQAQPQAPNLVQQIKQTISPMNIQTMHGGVIYTRQIPVNIGNGQTINLITVPSTELVNDSSQKHQKSQEGDPPIIKIVPTSQSATTPNGSTDEKAPQMASTNESNAHSNPQPQPQPVLTQMRIKLPMLSKAPQMVGGTRLVRPSFFQIQRNVIGGANQQVYQQLVLTAAPTLGQSIRLPTQTQKPKTSSETTSSQETQMSSSTLEQLREFDMVLEQVKERSTVQPGSSTSTNNFSKINTSDDTTDTPKPSTSTQETPTQVLYSVGTTQPLNMVNFVNRKSTITSTTTTSYVRSPDSTGIIESPSSSTHSSLPHTVTSESCASSSCASEAAATTITNKTKKKKPKLSTSNLNPFNIKNTPKPSSQKPLEDEQTTQRILYILAEYKEQVENSPDKDKPAPRRRNNPAAPNAGSSKRKKSSSGSRRRDMSPVQGEDSCRTMGSEDSSCGTSLGECNECLEGHSPEESPRKVVRRLTFEQETHITQTRTIPQRNVIVADGQAFAVRNPTGKPATTVLMPANYLLPVSMVKGGQQIAIVTNRGPKLLVGAGEGGTGGTLLFQRLIGPGLKPVLTRPGVRHIRLPTAALQNLQAFNISTPATTVQPPDSTASPAPAPNPPDLVDTRAMSSPWRDRDAGEGKPEGGSSSPEGSEPWNLPSSSIVDDYGYEEIVRTDNMDRTVLDAIPDRYSPDMEAQRIFDKMFDVDSKKSMYDSRCGYDIDASDDDKAYHQVVQRKDGRHTRLTHVSAAALRHKYAILEHELRLQKSLSEECEDLGVDSPSASELFPEAELLFAPSPAHEQTIEHCHTPQPTILSQGIPQPDLDDQIATDHLLTHKDHHDDLDINLDDVGEIVTVGEDGMTTIPLDHEEFARSHEEFARSHPNTTFHSEPEQPEITPFTIAQGIKGRQITFHARGAPGTVVMAPQTTVISQATIEATGTQNTVKFTDIDNIINAMPSSHQPQNVNVAPVLVKESNEGLTKFDRLLNESRELHLSNTASAIVHSTGNSTQVIRRVHYENRRDARYLIEDPDALISGEPKPDERREIQSISDGTPSPERHPELFWESNSVRPEKRRFECNSDNEKCCKSPYDETNSDSSGVGAHTRLDSVIKAARTERTRSDGSFEDSHPPLRTYPPKRPHPHSHSHHSEVDRSLTGKTRAGITCHEGKDESRRRASNRGVVKRGCHCCNGTPAPPKPKKSRPKKPSEFPN